MLRLALRGAWAATRFGDAVVEPYLHIIVERKHPLRCFDAVLGATAIALAKPRGGDAVVRDIERALRLRIERARDTNDRLVAEACLRSMYVAVHEPFLAEEKTLMRGRRRSPVELRSHAEDRKRAVFLALDDEIDCAEIDDHGFMPAILALPNVARASPELLFRSATTGDPDDAHSVARARVAFQRTSSLAACPCGSGKPAQECCAN
jgi:hypothetical protein